MCVCVCVWWLRLALDIFLHISLSYNFAFIIKIPFITFHVTRKRNLRVEVRKCVGGRTLTDKKNLNSECSRPRRQVARAINFVWWPLMQSVPLATEPGISLIILTQMKILQRNLNRSTFVVWEMKRNASVVRFKLRFSILISGKIIKEMPGSVVSGTLCIKHVWTNNSLSSYKSTWDWQTHINKNTPSFI